VGFPILHWCTAESQYPLSPTGVNPSSVESSLGTEKPITTESRLNPVGRQPETNRLQRVTNRVLPPWGSRYREEVGPQARPPDRASVTARRADALLSFPPSPTAPSFLGLTGGNQRHYCYGVGISSRSCFYFARCDGFPLARARRFPPWPPFVCPCWR